MSLPWLVVALRSSFPKLILDNYGHDAHTTHMLNARERLKLWLERSGLNQGEVGLELKIDRSSLCQIISGRRSPSLALAARIEAMTGIPASTWASVNMGKSAVSEMAESANSHGGNK